MRKYDFKKINRILKKVRSEIVAADLGMFEDWFWTAESVLDKKINSKTKIGGISGSSWATPTLRIEYKDGTIKFISCCVGEQERPRNPMFSFGVLSGPAQDQIDENILLEDLK